MWVESELREGRREPLSVHVIVLGNEKGGSGKSTTAMHLAIALMKTGQRVATIDLDSRQRTLTHYVDRRRAWAKKLGLPLELPQHYSVARAEGVRVDDNEHAEFNRFADAIIAVERRQDFVVVDTPGADTYLSRLAHSMADTLITPLNDSFLDLDVLASVDAETCEIIGTSHYAELVREARRHRRIVDGRMLDWVVVRNRLSAVGSRNRRLVGNGLTELGGRLGFRFVDGLAERMVYREFFPRGLTALDDFSETALGVQPCLSHVSAQREVQALLASLVLPINECGRSRAAARAAWRSNAFVPLDIDDVFVDESDPLPI